MDVVVSCFEKDVSGFAAEIAERFGARILTYYKCRPDQPYNVNVNKGHEASAYLKYILDHYDSMPDKVFFCHDEKYSWHHTGSIVDRLGDALRDGKEFVNVNHFKLGSIIDNPLYDGIVEWWREYCRPYVSNMDKYHRDWTLGHKGCAQFLVSSARIRMYPKAFYQGLYDWIVSTGLPNYVTSRYMEWTWHVFWDDPPRRVL
jgi:hypothetical protein